MADQAGDDGAHESFGELLRRLRLDRRIAQRTLAEMAGISNEAVSTLERGFRRVPREETLALLIKALALEEKDAEKLRRAASMPSRPPRRESALIARPGNVPRATTQLIGRATDLQKLTALLATHRLVTVTGTGGIGKTQMALAAAREFSATVPDGVWFVELAPVSSVDGVVAATADALDITISRKGDPNDRLATALANRQLLLVLDNCEHVSNDVARLAHVVRQTCPNVRILATSRSPLNAPGEAIYALPTLSIPAPGSGISLEDAGRFDATLLFVERARELDSSFQLTAENAWTISEICRKLDGIALAIELAARRTRSLGLSDILARLNRRFRLLTGGSPTVARQETLAALFDWSYDLLDADDKAFFEGLGIFPSSFTLDAARWTALDEPHDEHAALDRLDSLVSKSLIVRLDKGVGRTRYGLLETVREFAANRLSTSGRADDLRERFFSYVHASFKAAGDAFEDDPREEIVARVASETENRLATLEIACERGDALRGAEVLLATPFPMGFEDYVAKASARFANELATDCLELRSRLWARNAYDEFIRSPERAFTAKERAVACARSSGEPRALVGALQMVASIDMRMGMLDSASEALRESGTLPLSAALTRSQLKLNALLEHYKGNPDGAARQFREIALTERLRGNVTYEFDALHNGAESEHAAGHTQRALALARDAERLVDRLDRRRQANLLSSYTGYLVALGDFATARQVGRRALRNAGTDNYFAYILEHLALADALEGHFQRAATLLGVARVTSAAFTWNDRGFTEKTTMARLSNELAAMDPAVRERAEDLGSRFTRDEALAFLN